MFQGSRLCSIPEAVTPSALDINSNVMIITLFKANEINYDESFLKALSEAVER